MRYLGVVLAAVILAAIGWRLRHKRRDYALAVQAALSLAWACGAIILMLTGSRRGLRRLWQSGALLIGIVILKLFIVELGDSGGIARIISFIGVGVLLLAVSYFAPAPRKEE